MYYVYELRDTHNVIVYIGYTNNCKRRFGEHIKGKPNNNCGMGYFYGRDDLHLTIVKEFTDIKEAKLFEGSHKLANGFKWTEKIGVTIARSNGGKTGMGGKASTSKIYTCPLCSREVKGIFGYRAHLKKCKHDHDRARNRSEAFGF